MPNGLCCNRCCRGPRVGAGHGGGRCVGWSTVCATGCGWVVPGGMSQTGTGRGGGVYALFAAWQVAGVWSRLEQALIAAADAVGDIGWEVSVDSTINRAHQHAAGARKDSADRVVGEPADHALGRSRGGLTTKIHAAAEAHRGLLAHLITPGQDGDSPRMIDVLQRIREARPGRGRPRNGSRSRGPRRRPQTRTRGEPLCRRNGSRSRGPRRHVGCRVVPRDGEAAMDLGREDRDDAKNDAGSSAMS
jgi:transposase